MSPREELLSSKGLRGAVRVSFETVKVGDTALKGSYSGIDEEVAKVVTDQRSFDDLFERIFAGTMPAPKPPRLDFTKQSVVAVGLGTRSSGGYEIEVDSILEKDGIVHVIVRKREPAPGEPVTMALTQCYHVVSTRRLDPESVRFLGYVTSGS